MPRPDFDSFESDLRYGGVAPRHVARVRSELNDHFDDLVEDALDKGIEISAAERLACDSLGDLQEIAVDLRSRPELSSWSFRHPGLAIIAYPIMCFAVIPAAPVIAGLANAPMLARWFVCSLLGGLVTAAMMLFMQLTITLS